MRSVVAVVLAAAVAAMTAGGVSHGAAESPRGTTIHGAHAAAQVVTVTSTRLASVHAQVRLWDRTSGGGYRLVGGPWSAWIGRDGFAPRGDKREGDGRTPSGSFGFSFFFGTASRPHVHFPWRHAGPHAFWDDDSASPRYNEWVDTARHSAGRDPEPLDVSPSYDDVAVVAYNTARTPGRGSAIFLHVTHHSATSGCVAIPRHDVLRTLRWLRPADHPRIVMGTTHTVMP